MSHDPGAGMSSTAVSSEPFGRLPDGTEVDRYLLTDDAISVAVITYGGCIQELVAPDRDGRPADVVLGFDSLDGYLPPQPYLGALIGRYANRIGGARFTLNGTEYQLEANNGPNHLHGGSGGFHNRVWQARPLPGTGVRLELTSPDGDQGYPARLDVAVEYTLADGELRIAYSATNAEPPGGPATVLNLTNHVYLNLAGEAAGSVGDHLVEVPADRVVRHGPGLIPTGELVEVVGTPLDLRAPRPFAAGWDADHEQIAIAGGYDHSWLLAENADAGPIPAARITDPGSGRVLEVSTDQPVMHVYSGNMMDGTLIGKGGRLYPRRSGFCVETQHPADAPNHPNFPSTVLDAGHTLRTTTVLRFTTQP
jgi:aldose 1-epimerase